MAAKKGRRRAAPKAPPRGQGRPTKRTKDVERGYISALEEFGSFKLAADLCGLHRNTPLNWRREDEGFDVECREARAKFAVRELLDMKTAEQPGAWKRAAWMLERLMPEIFGADSEDDELARRSRPVRVEFVARKA